MPTINDISSVPEEDFQYPAITGPNIKGSSYNLLHMRVAQHYRANGQEPPPRSEVDTWMCINLTLRCHEGPEPFRNKFTDPPTYLQRGKPTPNWPLILRPFKLLAVETDRGLGDIVLRVIGDANSQAFKKWFESVFGRGCGCEKRQNTLNSEFPL